MNSYVQAFTASIGVIINYVPLLSA